MENSFYITFNSYKSDFKVNFAQNFELDEKWTVGLAQISLPKTWHNIYENQKLELLVYNTGKDNNIEVIDKDIYISQGHYNNKELVNEINTKIQQFIKDGKIVGTNKDSETVPSLDGDWSLVYRPGRINNNERYFVRFSEMISNIVGFQREDIWKKAKNTFTLFMCSDKLNPNQPYPFTDEFISPTTEFSLDKNVQLIEVKSDISSNHYFESEKTNIMRYFQDFQKNSIQFIIFL